jgi:hypothetical protein
MAEEHAKAIAATRTKLVKQRRNLVTDLGKKDANGKAEENLRALIMLQAAIDALDKAYEDEKADMLG